MTTEGTIAPSQNIVSYATLIRQGSHGRLVVAATALTHTIVACDIWVGSDGAAARTGSEFGLKRSQANPYGKYRLNKRLERI